MRGFEGEKAGARGGRGAVEKRQSSSAAVSPLVRGSESLENSTPAPVLPNSSAPLPQAKHIPERTCAACRTKMAQSDLYRIRKTPQGWTMDQSVKVGRSAYLCSSPYCHVEKRLKRIFGVQAAQIATHMSEVLKALEGPKEK